MGELSRRGVKAFAVLSFMASTSYAIAGRGAFHLFTPPPQYAAHAMQPTIRAESSHLSCGTGPRAPLNDVAQRGHMRRAEAEAKAMAIGNIVDVWRLDTVSPLQKRRADAFGNGHSARLKVRRCIVAWLEERFSASVCPRGG